MLQGLYFVMTHVPDVDKACAFYTEQLGFEIETQQPDFVQFKNPVTGGATYAIGATGPNQPAGTELWWFVDDADATHKEFVDRGVEIASPPADEPFGRTFSIKDPGGNILYMLQPARQG